MRGGLASASGMEMSQSVSQFNFISCIGVSFRRSVYFAYFALSLISRPFIRVVEAINKSLILKQLLSLPHKQGDASLLCASPECSAVSGGLQLLLFCCCCPSVTKKTGHRTHPVADSSSFLLAMSVCECVFAVLSLCVHVSASLRS